MKYTFTLIFMILALITPRVSHAALTADTQIRVSATADYTNYLNQLCSAQPASVVLTVQPVFGAKIEWRLPDEKIETAKIIYIPLKIANVGNASDIFDLSITSLANWDTSIVLDSSRVGIDQATTPRAITEIALNGGEISSCLARVTIPSDAATGDTITVKATSRLTPQFASATESIPIEKPVPKSSSLTLSAAPTSAVEGQKVSILGSLDPAIQESVALSVTDPAGTVAKYTCKPQTNGSFTLDMVTGKPGSYTVDGKIAATSSHAEGTARATFTVTNKTTSAIDLTATPATPGVNETVTVTGTLTPAAAASIDFVYQTPSGAIKTIAAKSDDKGKFSCSFTIVETGTWSVSAEYKGSDTVASVKSQISVEAHPSTQIAEHVITFDAAPSLSAAQVGSAETIACAASAADSAGDEVTYEWSDNSAGGTFAPSAQVASPSYTAPANETAADLNVKLTCTAKCSADSDISAFGDTSLVVMRAASSPPTVVSVAPCAGSNQAGLAADIVVKFSKKMQPERTELALVFKPAIEATARSWSADGTTLSVRHNPLASNISYDCSIATTAVDASGVALATDYRWSFTTVPLYRFDTSETGANPSTVFSTPKLIMSDPMQPSYMTVKIHIPEGLIVNSVLDSSGNLDCVRRGADVGAIQSSWDAKTREITIAANVINPSASVEVVKAIRLASSEQSGVFQVKAQGMDALTVNVKKLVPGDFNGDGAVNMTDATRFLQEWVRWQKEIAPAFDVDLDERFDLAPHTDGIWPAWTIIGDRLIDEKDSKAFADCWAAAHLASASAASSAYINLSKCDYKLTSRSLVEWQVMVYKTTNGTFEVTVPTPPGMQFDPSVGVSGNLNSVIKEQGAGSIFFTEYHPATKTVRIAGVTSGRLPFIVATVLFSKQQ